MNIYEVLEKDHEEVKDLLSQLVSLDENDEYRFVLIEEISKSLIPHARAEESVFYNTLRAVNADKGIVMHGYKEHLEAESLLRALQVMDKVNLDWKATAQKLKEAVEHHVQDEESDIFEKAKNVFTQEEAQMMAEAFEGLKNKVEQQGSLKNTMDMVLNMMPPRIADKIRDFGSKETNG